MEIKEIGIYHDVAVKAALPINPLDSPYCFCTVNDKPITEAIIYFSRESWKDENVLHECFIAAVGIGVSTYLKEKEN